MRAVLEANVLAVGTSQFCLRDDILLLSFVDRVSNLNPPKLIRAIQEVATLSDDFDDVLSVSFNARMLGPEAQREGFPRRLLGKRVSMALLARALAEGKPPNMGEALEVGESQGKEAQDLAAKGRRLAAFGSPRLSRTNLVRPEANGRYSDEALAASRDVGRDSGPRAAFRIGACHGR